MKDNFWDDMAKTYPRYDDVDIKRDVEFVLNWCKEQGVDFSGKTILDVGCGTWAMAIPLDQLGAVVTAGDTSNAMLEALQEDAKSVGVEVKTIKSDGDSFESGERFDIVLAYITLAGKSIEAIEKLINYSKSLCIYVGWGAYKKNNLFIEILEAHKAEPKKGGGCIKVPNFIEMVAQKGYTCKSGFFQTQWDKKMSFEDALSHINAMLDKDEFIPDQKLIKEEIRRANV